MFFAFILESLGATELLFILAIALIFFGPRKLPQLARSMGKGLAEFRKASDDFKRTWEREVALETGPDDDHSITASTSTGETVDVTAADANSGIDSQSDPQLEPAGVQPVREGLAQGPVQPEFPRKQHHPRIGAPPEDGLPLAEPGKDAG